MRALIVDDSSFIRSFLRQQLERLGMEVVEAVNGQEGLDTLRTDESFGLMMVDVNMPVMLGLECVRLVREEGLGGDTLRVMMVTTEADNCFIEQALGYGADEFLMKPFTPQSLREKLLLLGIG